MSSLLFLALLLANTSCLSVQWNQVNIDEPVSQQCFDILVVGHDNLGTCLAVLGAPTRIEDFEGDDDDQFALLWTWSHTNSWGVTLSGGRFTPVGSFSFADAAENLRAVRLLFDADLGLIAKQKGMLRGLLHDYTSAQSTRRPGRR